MKKPLSLVFLCMFYLALFFISSADAALSINGYTMISSVRVSRTDWTITYTANITNTGNDAKNVTATLISNSIGTTVLDGLVTFGIVPAGATVTSSDTFQIRQNRSYPFNQSAMVWSYQFTPSYIINGTVSSLVGSGLILKNNGADDLAITSNGAFLFSKTIYDGDAYNVTISSQPVAPPQVCAVTNGSGVVAGGDVNVAVTCSADTTPPQITISAPTDKEVFYSNAVTVQGNSNEPLSSVLINGVPATISGFSFSLSSLPLNFCSNQINIMATDLSGNVSTRSITVIDNSKQPPVTSESGYLIGYVYEAVTETPIQGARVTNDFLCGSVVTDVNGRYVFPLSGFLSYSSTKEFNFLIEKSGYTPINTSAKGQITKEEVADPVYLTRIDPQVTTITAAVGGLAVNSAGDTQVIFPPGSAPRDIDVSITMFDGEKELPAPLGGNRILYAIGQFEPHGTVFDQPVTVRLPNKYNMPPGTIIPCVDYDPETKKWNDVNDGVVSADGKYIDLEVLHFSWYGARWIPDVVDEDPDPPTPNRDDVEDQTKKDTEPDCEEKSSGNSSVCLKKGALELTHSIIPYKSMGLDQGLTLYYDSSAASFSKIVSFNIAGNRSPKYTEVTITAFGQSIKRYFNIDSGKFSARFDAKDFNGAWIKTGDYPYSLKLTNYFDVTRRTQWSPGEWVSTVVEKNYSADLASGVITVNNQMTSPFGSGWQLGGLSRLNKDHANGPAIIDDSGKVTQFTNSTYSIDTLAGGAPGDGGTAVQANLNYPRGIVVDGAGNIYIADTDNNRIRKVDTNGVITTVAGTGVSGFSGDGGLAAQALLKKPKGITIDGAGNIYIADTNNHRIRKVDASGIITTFAGTGISGFSGDGGAATLARLNRPQNVTIDTAGNIYIADVNNNRIRKVDTNGIITTFAGTGTGGFSGDGGPANLAKLYYPESVAADSSGNIFIADAYNNRIRKVDAGGIITTFAGIGVAGTGGGFSGDGGPATLAKLNYPEGVTADSSGNIFIADSNNRRVRKVDVNGIITTFTGTGEWNFSGDGGVAALARITYPEGIAVDSSGNVYIADTFNHRIRKINTNNIITTVAGNGSAASTGRFSGDEGAATQASLNYPRNIAVDGAGNIYIADTDNNRIRKVDTNNIITTFAGTGISGFSGDGGLAAQASLKKPKGIAVDAGGNVYIADTNNHQIRKVDTSGIITTIAGTGISGFSGDGGAAALASLNRPQSLAIDRAGNIYIADLNNHRIRKIDTSGIITTFAGTVAGFSGDGGPATLAKLYYPENVAADSSGNIFIADAYNNRIRKVDAGGIITTFAGIGGAGFSGDGGPATLAKLHYPEGVTADPSGNVYIADSNNHRIRKVDLSGAISTFAGTGEWNFSGDGGPAILAKMTYPEGLTTDASGNIYISDTFNHRIRVSSLSALNPISGKLDALFISHDNESSFNLLRNGTSQLTLKNGIKKFFNAKGLQTSVVERNGNTYSYQYDINDNLIGIVDPILMETRLEYLNGHIQTITTPDGKRTSFQYDMNGNLISITDPDGGVTSYFYDSRHLLTSKTGPDGHTTTYNYNTHGQVVSVVSANGETRNYSPSDSQGLLNDLPAGVGTRSNLSLPIASESSVMTDGKGFTTNYRTNNAGATVESTDPLGNRTFYERDKFSRPIRMIKPNGSQVSMTYDKKGNLLTRTLEGLGATTSYTYSSDFNQVTSITDPLGNVTYFNYDALGNMIEVADAQNNRTLFTYYPNGLIQATQDALGNVTTYQYDAVNWNLLKITKPDLSETSYTYDSAGNVLTLTDPEGKVTSSTYNVMNHVTTVTDPNGGVTTYTYSPGCGCPTGGSENLISITDAKGQVTQFEYNGIGQVTKVTNPKGEIKTYTYDLNRNLESITDAKGQVITFTYDGANRLISKTAPDDLVQYVYDANGNVTGITDSDSGLSFVYDEYGRLMNANTLLSLKQPATTTAYSYDLAGRKISVTNPSGTTAGYGYDSLNRLTSITTAGGQTVSLAYDSLGRRTNLTMPNGIAADYSYDALSRLTNLLHHNGAVTTDFYDYTYDRTGNRTSISDSDGLHNYLYDNIYQLTEASHTSGLENFAYDLVGNRLTSTSSASYLHDTANRLLQDDQYSYTYDANGNRISKRDLATGEVTSYLYDAENRLTRVTSPSSTSTYAYDPLGRRIEKNVNGNITRYIYDNEDILLELNGLNIGKALYTHGPGIDEPLAMERDTDADGFYDQRVYYHLDGLGSVKALTDDTGATVQSYQYDSFGKIISSTGTVESPYTYTSREFDSETGLYYYRARYYDAVNGRFMNEDPIGFEGGDNFYTYVQNNPVNLIDPDGLQANVLGAGWSIAIAEPTPVGEVLMTVATVATAAMELKNIFSKGGDKNVRDTGLQDLSDQEVSRRAHDKKLTPKQRRRYQTEEKARKLRNKGKRCE